MLMTVYDVMGVPYQVDSSRIAGLNTVGVLPLPAGNRGPVGDWTNSSSLNDSANSLIELSNLHNTLLVGNQLVASGTGSDASAQMPTSTIRRPWLDMPESGVPFDPQTAVVLPAVAGSATIVTLTVPDGYDGVINAYSVSFTGGGFVQGSGDLQFQLLRNGAAIRNYDNILVEKGTIQQPRPISPLRIYSGQVISIVVNHLANGLLAGNVIGCFSGYFYPSAS